MKLTNVRLGFANNSSSSHSILLFPKGHKFKDLDSYDASFEKDCPYYGWESFVLASEEEKKKYFVAQLTCILKETLGLDITKEVINSLFKPDYPFIDSQVDHQSQLVLPHYADGTLALDFLKELFQYSIKNKNVVIFGGNDNGDDLGPEFNLNESDYESIAPLSLLKDSDIPYVARKEPGGWTLFNPGCGVKVRFQSSDWKVADVKPNTPELVDVKITDYCGYSGSDVKDTQGRCFFCYQNSGLNGKHAERQNISGYFRELREMGVFEVVLGGGEPLSHPDFISILKDAKYYKLIPNFTTRSYGSFNPKNTSLIEAIRDCVGSFAVSVTSVQDAKRALKNVFSCGKEIFDKMVLQIIIGVVPPQEIVAIKKIAEAFDFFKFSYVGWKDSGRCKEPPVALSTYTMPQDILNLNAYWGRVWVDTALLKAFPQLVEKYTCDTREGVHSMYMDLVEMTISESSYTGNKIPFPKDFYKNKEYQDTRDFISKEFAKFGKAD